MAKNTFKKAVSVTLTTAQAYDLVIWVNACEVLRGSRVRERENATFEYLFEQLLGLRCWWYG